MKALFSILFLPQIGDVVLEPRIKMSLLITSSLHTSGYVSNPNVGAKMKEEGRSLSSTVTELRVNS